ncbi:hypothetical protein MCOR16_011063 [Pyricularia oryzae]|nr:hypothetical protein MCOR16_011063 [Pyricularia oryzae]
MPACMQQSARNYLVPIVAEEERKYHDDMVAKLRQADVEGTDASSTESASIIENVQGQDRIRSYNSGECDFKGGTYLRRQHGVGFVYGRCCQLSPMAGSKAKIAHGLECRAIIDLDKRTFTWPQN